MQSVQKNGCAKGGVIKADCGMLHLNIQWGVCAKNTLEGMLASVGLDPWPHSVMCTFVWPEALIRNPRWAFGQPKGAEAWTGPWPIQVPPLMYKSRDTCGACRRGNTLGK